MRGWLPIALGILGIVVGAVWTLQGLGYVTGSVMTGQRIWVAIGPFVVLTGATLVLVGLRVRGRYK